MSVTYKWKYEDSEFETTCQTKLGSKNKAKKKLKAELGNNYDSKKLECVSKVK